MSFLNAEWRKLAIFNYPVDVEVLSGFVPAGTELDFFNEKTYLSLVGFYFQNTRLLGLKIPFHVNFEEVNLRFYVRRFEHGVWKRGVVFIREIVPRNALRIVANTVYHENYVTHPMRHNWTHRDGEIRVQYQWLKDGKWNTIEIRASHPAENLVAGSKEAFITEHYWGYAARTSRKTVAYEVTHPVWKVYPVTGHTLDVDFRATYGEAFAFLDNREPESVMLAEGSPITVEKRQIIRIG